MDLEEAIFTKTFAHKTPHGTEVVYVGGTQTIDRFWRTFRSSVVGQSCVVGSHAMERRIRSCQWEYWFKGEDLWIKTGEMLQTLATSQQPSETHPRFPDTEDDGVWHE